MDSLNVESCVHCGLCTQKCIFLENYGLDLEKFSRRPDLAYSCFLCGRCKEVCPRDIDGAAVAVSMRSHAAEEAGGVLKDSDYRGLLWEKNPYKFSNYRRGKTKSVLFPGCSFPSFYPKTMRHLERMMRRYDIGAVYECCRKPVYELGMKRDALGGLSQMEQRLKKQGVEELIMLCPNCYYFMKDKIDLPVMTVYEKLRELGEGADIERERFPVYYPCPDRREKEMFREIQYFLKGPVEAPFENVQCCGLGGCAAVKEPELAEGMVRAAGDGEQLKMYTYCASCISNYRRKGFRQTFHFLPLILGIDEKVPLRLQPFLNRARKKL